MHASTDGSGVGRQLPLYGELERRGQGLPRGVSGQRGFTLLELMVVVILVGLLTALAIPSMSDSQYSRVAYDDAASIAGLFRNARTRAIGRGAAVTVSMTSSNAYTGPDRGTFRMFEAQLVAALGPLPVGSPMNTCGTPTVWPGMAGASNAVFLDGVSLNGPIETQGVVYSVLNDFVPSTPTTAWMCFTPLGRMYYANTAVPAFVAGNPTLGSIQIVVRRADASGAQIGIKRTVLIPPSGAARIVSQ